MLRMRLGRLFVEFYAEPRAIRRIHQSASKAHILADDVLAPRHVVEKRLVDAIAWRRNAQGESDCVCDGAGRIVRAERNMVRIADGGDLLHPRNATRMRRVRLKVVAAAKLYRVKYLLRSVKPFAAGDWNAHARAHVRKRTHRVGNDRFLDPIRRILLERVAYP